MSLRYNGVKFILDLSSLPSHVINGLAEESFIYRTNRKKREAYIAPSLNFCKRGWEALKPFVKPDEEARKKLVDLSKEIDKRRKLYTQSHKLKRGVFKDLSPEAFGLRPHKGFQQLFVQQARGIHLCALRRRYALFFGPRTGKTITMLGAYLKICQDDKRNYRMLIFSENTYQHVWQEHIKNCIEEDVECLKLYEDFKKHPNEIRDKLKTKNKLIALANYTFRSPEKYKILKEFNPDLIVLDESQKMRSSRKLVLKENILNVAKQCDMKFCPSGTPVGQNYLSVWSQFQFLDPETFPQTKTAFLKRYCYTKMLNSDVSLIIGYKRKDELKDITKQNSYRVITSHVYEVSKRNETRLYIDLDDDTAAIYNQFIKAVSYTHLTLPTTPYV